jgi:hypothetical protein
VAAVVLLRGGIAAAGVVSFVVVAAALLAPAHLWRPAVALPVCLVGAALAVRLTGRVPIGRVPVPAAAATVLVAVGHGTWAALTHAEHVVIRRDAGSYAQYAQWIATRHGLPVTAQAEAFGGAAALADPAFGVGSPAFYEVLHGSGADLTATVVPQFLPGAPALWSLGYWAAGWTGLLVAPAVVGALAVLAVGGLAARLAGPWAGPLAALVLALCQPVLHAARSTYSEPVALLLIAAAASLLVDAVASRPDRGGAGDRARGLALAAGIAFGLAGLVRVDAVREVAALLPVAALLALRGHPAAGPLVRGAVAGSVLSLVWALLFSRPYLGTVAASLAPLVAGTVVLGLASWAAVRVGRRGGGARVSARVPTALRSPRTAAAIVVLTGLVLASRPLWQVVRQDPQDSGSRFVARLQPGQGLAVDGGRTYAEHSVVWVSWWTGPLALVLALTTFAGLAALVVRWWRTRLPDVPGWLGPAVVGFASTVLTLYRPGITPDHPWADRRLVPVVLPTVVIAAVAALVAGLRASRHRRTALRVTVAAAGAIALLVPPFLATLPVAAQRTEVGELGSVRTLCRALGPRDAVLAVDSRAINEWPQVVRGVCDRPAGVIRPGAEPMSTVVSRVAGRVVAAGYRPVLLAADDDALLTALGLAPERVVSLVSVEDQRLLVRRPAGDARLTVDVWLASWPAGP